MIKYTVRSIITSILTNYLDTFRAAGGFVRIQSEKNFFRRFLNLFELMLITVQVEQAEDDQNISYQNEKSSASKSKSIATHV